MKINIKLKYLIIVSIIALVLVIDLLGKHFFCYEQEKTIIPNLINFKTNYGNDGAGFGLFGGKKFFLIIFTIFLIICFCIVDILSKQKSLLYTISFSFIIGGALGNLIDRISLGYVRDFINFSFWTDFPTYNFADTFLCMGIFFMCIYLIFGSNKREKNGK